MCSACRLMVFKVCVKFHENMSSGFKVMERTRKLLTDIHTHTEKRRKHYTPMAYFVCWGYKYISEQHYFDTNLQMMDCWLAISCPSRLCFSHVRMIGA